jgi:hypothetical protein
MNRKSFHRLTIALASLAAVAPATHGQLLQQQPTGLIQPNQPPGMLAQRPVPAPTAALTGCQTNELKFTFYTGGDDLRGGNDNLNIEIHLADGSIQVANNVNQGNNWKNNSQNTVSVPLKQPVQPFQIKEIKLIHGSQGGVNPGVAVNAGGVPDPLLGTLKSIQTEDNWDLNSSLAYAVLPQSAEVPIASTGVFRFTGTKPSFDMTMNPNPGCANPNAVSSLKLIFQTGDDDLRGGNDNLNVTIAGNGFSQEQDNVNGSQQWQNNSTHTVVIPLNKQVTVDQLRGIQLYATFQGGSGGDNWNMQSLEVYANTASTSKLIATQGFYRFTGPPGNKLSFVTK